ncbi:hydantoinase/oxoprolinase family protein, partial [Nonomuraea sp. NN258]|nr:hydantoinase/oxoprolinase family protein [Nonomuraea antri]
AETAPPPGPAAEAGRRPAYFPELGGYVDVPVWSRAGLSPFDGPGVVEDAGSTIVVPPGWHAALDRAGAVILTRGRPS